MSRVAVVTGAGGDMGLACARALAATGHTLLLTDLDPGRLTAVADTLGVTGTAALAGDLTDPAFPAELAGRALALGELGPLVQTAGLSPTMADWRRILAVDLVAVVRCLDAFRPHVTAGSVAVCLASVSAHMGAFDPAVDAVLDDPHGPDLEDRLAAALAAGSGAEPDPGGVYRLAKRGVVRACERAAVDWGAAGGRVLSLSPGLVDTGMGRLELDAQPIKTWLAALTPVGHGRGEPGAVLPGRVEDIADTVAFLCSERAAFLSGTDVLVDGGLLAALRAQG